jgi:hypothetical protein
MFIEVLVLMEVLKIFFQLIPPFAWHHNLDLRLVWIGATTCLANYLVLTRDAGRRLDGSQDSLSLPIFWSGL